MRRRKERFGALQLLQELEKQMDQSTLIPLLALTIFALAIGWMFYSRSKAKAAQKDDVQSKLNDPAERGDLSPTSPPSIERIRWFIFGLMRPVFAMSFSLRTHLV